MEEAEVAHTFATLKTKYLAASFKGTSPSSRLFVILQKIETGTLLNKEDITWLDTNRLHQTLGLCYEKQYDITGDQWNLVNASRRWRRAGEPGRSLELTENIASSDIRLLAAAMTSRGGAFRDLNQLEEAEQCAYHALTYSSRAYQPYNLLGAICFQRGDPVTGDKYFMTAAELGAPSKNQTDMMENALQRLEQDKSRAVAEYLLQKDSVRYKWAEYYLR